jgi:quercetin dioxygenase-like cupin family protein
MTGYALRLLEDQLEGDTTSPTSLQAVNRVIYVVEGDITVTAESQVTRLTANTAWHGPGMCTITPGAHGARLWRWELVSLPVDHNGLLTGDTVISTAKLSCEIDLDSQSKYLMRCDRVDFPPGGIAYTHTHQGPGIRCLLLGAFTVQVLDKQALFHPGGAWFEIGPEPVYAAASSSEPAAFVRVMILPRALKGKSSIRYVKPEDLDKPKAQQYTIFLDQDIDI